MDTTTLSAAYDDLLDSARNVLLLDDRVPLVGLIDGLAGSELPGHTAQLLALLPRE